MSNSQTLQNFDKKWFSVFTITTISIILGYSVYYFYPENFSFFTNISLILYTAIPGGLVLVSIWAIKSKIFEDIPKKPLILLSLSFFSWFTAEQLWMLYDYVFNIDPFPSMADVFYTSAPILMLLALIIFLKPYKNKISKKNIGIAIILSLVLLIPTVINTYQDSEGADFVELLIGIIYPIADALVIIPAVIIISVIFQKQKNLFWIMILIGIFVLIAADTSYLFLVLSEEYYDDHPVDVLWLLSYLVWSFTLLRSINKSKKKSHVKVDVEKYETRVLSKYGITSFLIGINAIVVIVLFSIHNLSNNQDSSEFLEFFTAFLVMMMIIFSIMIIFVNKTMYKNLETSVSQLKNTSDELIKAERFSAIGELAARLAHDLRNPLGIIVASNSIIKEITTDEKIIKNIEHVEHSVNRMEHQINNVLDFVRMKSLDIQKNSLQIIIGETLKNVIIPKGILIKKPIEDPKIQCDLEQFSIALYNIIINSIQKLTDKGNIVIKYEQNKLSHIIRIEDSGEPIDDEILEKIFEPLFTTKHQGTGLGLASCKSIVEQHKGIVFAKNNPTSIIIKIPKEKSK